MNQKNTTSSGLRELTLEEINDVSGGFAFLPFLGAVLLRSLLITFEREVNRKQRQQNDIPNNPDYLIVPRDPGFYNC